ncbi:MAG: TetR family transcriptional regulator [Clostridia bacterium]|nr:TetR family transcriptional regulator [Clostridia bacterium]
MNETTKTKIAEAFMEVLRQKPFANIKVKDIIDVAGVSHMTFYRNYSDMYDLVEKICYEDLMLFSKIYGRNAEWKAIVFCILNTIKNNAAFYGKILKDEQASDSFIRALCRVSIDTTGAQGSKTTQAAWCETMQKWAKKGFSESVESVYIELVGAMPLHEVFTGEDLRDVIRAYETNTMDDFRNRLKYPQKKEQL